jgi:4-hydroxy-tetrahydrodipicolinate reductase
VIKLAVIGVSGRMGRAIIGAVNERAGEFEVVAGITSATSAADLPASLARSDVVMDFSNASATSANVAACERARKPIVIGTTGFSSDALRQIEKSAQSIAVLVAPNTSIGVTLLVELVKAAAKTLPRDFDIEISEAHHRNKRDAPSGTALALGRAAAEARGQDFAKVAKLARSGESPRQPGEIGFAVTRGGDIVGDHTVLFAGPGEHIVLGHRAADRTIFARGALQAAAWLYERPAGRYAMRDVVGYKTEG